MSVARPVVSAAAERIYDRLRPYHADDAASGYVLLHLCEAAAILLRKPTEAARHDERGSGARRMRDPDRAPAWSLAHLRQYVGIDYVPAATSEADERALIRSAPRLRRGHLSTLVTAIKTHLAGERRVRVIQRAGGFRHRVLVITYESETPDAELDAGELVSASIRAAIAGTKPARLKVQHRIDPGWLLADLHDAYAGQTLADLAADFPTIAALNSRLPA